MTDDRIERLRRLDDAATPGPWLSYLEGRDHWGGDSFIYSGESDIYIQVHGDYNRRWSADQDLVAAMRNAWPAVIELVEGLMSRHSALVVRGPAAAVTTTCRFCSEIWPCVEANLAIAVLKSAAMTAASEHGAKP